MAGFCAGSQFSSSKSPTTSSRKPFKSHAHGKPKPVSDIDLAIVFENFVDRFDLQVALMKLGCKIDTRIEPHPFRLAEFNASSPLAFEVLK